MLTYLLAVPTGAEHTAAALQFVDWALKPKAQLMLATGAGVWPMNKDVVLPPALATELGGNVAETMAHNYDPDWYVVGSALEERTRRIEEVIRSAH